MSALSRLIDIDGFPGISNKLSEGDFPAGKFNCKLLHQLFMFISVSA